jgi:hypothetical protein
MVMTRTRGRHHQCVGDESGPDRQDAGAGATEHPNGAKLCTASGPGGYDEGAAAALAAAALARLAAAATAATLLTGPPGRRDGGTASGPPSVLWPAAEPRPPLDGAAQLVLDRQLAPFIHNYRSQPKQAGQALTKQAGQARGPAGPCVHASARACAAMMRARVGRVAGSPPLHGRRRRVLAIQKRLRLAKTYRPARRRRIAHHPQPRRRRHGGGPDVVTSTVQVVAVAADMPLFPPSPPPPSLTAATAAAAVAADRARPGRVGPGPCRTGIRSVDGP